MKTTIQWAAGLLDGEGWFGLHGQSRRSVLIRVHQAGYGAKSLLSRLQSILGGHIRTIQETKQKTPLGLANSTKGTRSPSNPPTASTS